MYVCWLVADMFVGTSLFTVERYAANIVTATAAAPEAAMIAHFLSELFFLFIVTFLSVFCMDGDIYGKRLGFPKPFVVYLNSFA